MKRKKSSSKKESIIYSKLSHEEFIDIKRNIWEIQASLLGMIKKIREYKELRKQELLFKINLRKKYQDINDSINKIIKDSPKTKAIKEIEAKHKEKMNKSPKINRSQIGLSIEAELAEIQKKLEDMNKNNF